MKMNETLRFSWGHIFAFLAIIFIGYLSFMGLVYLMGGEGFWLALGIALGICVLLLLIFLGLQRLKATPRLYEKRIKWERTLLFASPVLFLLLLLPYCHFWRVNTRSREIVSAFKDAVSTGNGLFAEYEAYASDRIADHAHKLDSLVAGGRSADFQALGIANKGRAASRKLAMEKSLELQLLPEKYDTLRNAALQWIGKADKGASIWNIFLMGNIREIKNAFSNWNGALRQLSEPVLNSETYHNRNGVEPFESAVVPSVVGALDSISPLYREFRWAPHWLAVLTLLFLYGCLLLPYLVQDRHSKSVVKVFSKTKTSSFMEEGPSDDGPDGPDEPESPSPDKPYDDFKSFTI